MRALALLPGALLVVVGCAGTSLTDNADIDALRHTSVTTQEEVHALREMLESREAERTDATAEILLTLEDLETRFDRLEAQLTDLLDGLERFRGTGPAPGPGPGSGGPLPGDAATPPAIAGAPADPRAEYEAAYLKVRQGHYAAAIEAFEAFVRAHPSSDLADNAIYWIGESHYASRDFNRAAEAFVRLIDSYPSGDKVAAAMLKLGFAFQENGDTAAARRYLETLVERFPDSEEAEKARARLNEL